MADNKKDKNEFLSMSPDAWKKWKADYQRDRNKRLASLGLAERKAKENYSTFTTQARDQLTQAVRQLKSSAETDALRRGLSRSSIHGSIVGGETARMEKEIGKQTDAAKSAMDKTLTQVSSGRRSLANADKKVGETIKNIDGLFKTINAVNAGTVNAVLGKNVPSNTTVTQLESVRAPENVVNLVKGLIDDANKEKKKYGSQNTAGYDDVKKKMLSAYGLKDGDYDPTSTADTLGNRLYWAAMGATNNLVNSLKLDYDIKTAVAAADAKIVKAIDPAAPTITALSSAAAPAFNAYTALENAGLWKDGPKGNSDKSIDNEKLNTYFENESKRSADLSGIQPHDEKDTDYYKNVIPIQATEAQWASSGYTYDESDAEDVERRARMLPPKSFLKWYANSEDDKKRLSEGKLPAIVDNTERVVTLIYQYNAELYKRYEEGTLSPEALADLNAKYPEVAEINRLEQQRQMMLNNAHKDGFAIGENDSIMTTLGGKYDIKALKSAGFQESLGVRLLNYSNRPAAAASDTEALTKAITDQGVSQEDAGKIVAGMQQKMNSGIDPQSALKDAWEEVFVPLDPWEQRLRLQQQDEWEKQERMRPKFSLGDKGTGDWDKDKDILIDQYDSELQRWMNERLTPDYYLSARGIFPEINFDAYLDVLGIEHEEHEKQKTALRFIEVKEELDQGVALYDIDPNLLGAEVKVSPAKNAKERMERLFTWARILKLDVAVFPQSENDLLLRYLPINTNVDPDLVDKGSKDIKNLYTTWDDELRAQTRMPSFSAGATLAIDAATDPQNIGVHLITPDEAAQINYYYGKGDYDKADKLFYYYKDKHATEYAQTMAAGFASTDSDVLKIALALLSWAPATAYAAETVGNAIVGGGRATPESMASMALRAINAGQASVVDKIDSPVGQFFAQAGFSIVQNAPLLATGPAAPYIMAISAAGHASLDAKDRGATGWQQLGEAVAYGMAEYLGEKVSLGGLNKIINSTGKKTFLNFIKKVGAQMGTEFTEESATEVMQILSDVAIMGDKSEMSIYFQNYLKEHPGEQTDAILATVAKAATQVLYAGGQGVLSGLGFGGGATSINYVLPSSIQAPVGGGYGIDFNTSIQNLSESISSRVDRITAALQGKFNQQIDSLNNFLWNQTNPSFNPYSQPAFAMAGGPATNTRFMADTSNVSRSRMTVSPTSFTLNINENTGRVNGLQARNLETRLNEKLAATGRTVTPGDRYAVTVRRGRYEDGVLYQAGQEIKQSDGDSATHILEALGTGDQGKTINFKRVTDEALRKMERGAAEGGNVAEVAGDGEGSVEYINVNQKDDSPQVFDYRKTFFDVNPDLQGKVIVHHSIEQQVLQYFPGLFSRKEINRYERLRGIPIEVNSVLHLSKIRKEWNQFYKEIRRGNIELTQKSFDDKAKQIDDMFGDTYLPPIDKED